MLAFMLLLMSVGTSYADTDMIVEHYDVDDGLPGNIVYSALKDSDGFLWFGTWHGMCLFDGTRFFPYTVRRSKTSDMPPRKITRMVEDADGYIWIRDVDNHVYLFDRRTEVFRNVFFELRSKSQNVQVIKICRMHNGHILMLTRDKSMYEAYADETGNPVLEKIFDSYEYTEHTSKRLLCNVLGETDTRIYWIDRRHNICAVEKPVKRPVLRGMPKDVDFTCCNNTDGYLCAGTADGEVYIVDVAAGKVERYAFDELQHEAVTSVIPAGGVIYVTTSRALYSFVKGGDVTLLSTAAGGAVSPFIDGYGKLWMNIGRRSLVCYNPSEGSTHSFVMPADSVKDVMTYCDAGINGLFMLTLSGDVWRYDHSDGTMESLSQKIGATGTDSKRHFFDIYMDNDGRLWLSSMTDGVYKISFPRRSFTFLYPELLSKKDKLGEKIGVRAVCQTRGGDLWVGTRGGELYQFDGCDGGVKQCISDDIGNVYHIMEDADGNLWFSTKGNGLIKATSDATALHGLRMTRYRRDGSKYSINSDKVYNTFQDKSGRIWVCTFSGGLNLIEQNGEKVLFHNKDNSFTRYPKYDLYTNVRGITEDNDGRLWVGTTDGLMSLGGDFGDVTEIDFETFRDENSASIADDDIFTLFRDRNSNIWIGTFGGGLHKIEGYDEHTHRPKLRAYSFAERNGGGVVSSIAEDTDRYLWICTENGLASLQPSTLQKAGYDRFAGFPAVHIEDNTSMVTADGRVLIGCNEGLLAFDPAQVRKENSMQHSTFIVDFKVHNRSLADFDPPICVGSPRYMSEIELSHDQNMFTIEFATLTYTDPERLSYTYILDGYEDRWHDNGNNRYASYANVPPGKYTFRVKPADGNSPECIIKITVRPPWWASWWAYIIYFVLACALLYGILRLVLYTIRMRNEVYISDRLAELKLRFFTNISHELRTPLTLIKGPVDELKNNESLSDAGKEYLALIDRNAAKMLQLVNQILDFRKVQSGKMKMHVSLVNMNEMLESFCEEYRVMADECDIAFRLEMPGESVMVWCDAEKVRSVIGNLVSNAFKFTPAGGTICISIDHDAARNVCRVSVEDDGRSIPKAQLEQIFERFSQADNDAVGSYAGTGIGLSLSREFVSMHHGKIWAENNPGDKGVTFIMELPTDKEHFGEDVDIYFDDKSANAALVYTDEEGKETAETGSTDAEETAAEPSSERPTILIVEDNADLCRMMSLQLKKHYNVYTAGNGEEGLKKTYSYRPDIIISDLMMPGMDGMEMLRRVRKDFNISHTPVIILTAKHNEQDMMAAVSGGANAYITKPFSSDYLMARIKQLIEEQRIFQRKMAMHRREGRDKEDVKNEYEQHIAKKDLMFMEQIHEIIERNINSDDFNINTIAETIGLSRSAFFKKLKSLTGFAPVDLVRDVRLTKAADMIETTDENITTIAYSVGFHDVGYFGKCFKQKFGKTPKDYRADFRKG